MGIRIGHGISAYSELLWLLGRWMHCTCQQCRHVRHPWSLFHDHFPGKSKQSLCQWKTLPWLTNTTQQLDSDPKEHHHWLTNTTQQLDSDPKEHHHWLTNTTQQLDSDPKEHHHCCHDHHHHFHHHTHRQHTQCTHCQWRQSMTTVSICLVWQMTTIENSYRQGLSQVIMPLITSNNAMTLTWCASKSIIMTRDTPSTYLNRNWRKKLHILSKLLSEVVVASQLGNTSVLMSSTTPLLPEICLHMHRNLPQTRPSNDGIHRLANKTTAALIWSNRSFEVFTKFYKVNTPVV